MLTTRYILVFSPCFKWYTSDVTSRIETEVAVLLITGENFNISWPILRELGRVQSSGLKIGITRGNSSIPFNLKKKKKKSRGLVFQTYLFKQYFDHW